MSNFDQLAIQHLVDEAKDKRLSLFVGGELSASVTGVPSHRQLADRAIAQFQPTLLTGHSLPEVAQAISGFHYNSLIRLLAKELESSELSVQPFDFMLAQLPIPTIITTRFDDLIEKAFAQAQKPLTTIVSDQDVLFQSGNRTRLLKLYGDLRQPASLTITQIALLNLSIQKPGLVQQLANSFNGTLLLLGQNLNSPDFLALWSGAQRMGNLTPKAYAAYEQIPSDEERTFWQQHNIALINLSAEKLLYELMTQLNPQLSSTGEQGDIKSQSIHPPVEKFLNFHLELGRNATHYFARVLQSQEGAVEEVIEPGNILSLNIDSLNNITGVDREVAAALMPPLVRARWEANCATAQREGAGVRLCLRITSPDLSLIPWEAALQEERRPALRVQSPFVRYVPTPRPAESILLKGKLRTLVVIIDSWAIGLSALSEGLERSAIEEALAPLQKVGKLEIHWLTGKVTAERLMETVRQRQPHLLHFVGHGEVRELDEKTMGGLFLAASEEPSNREAVWINAEQFALMFDGTALRFAILNSCQTGVAVDGVAESLVRSSLTAAVGMQANVPDKVALQFASVFYRTLADGWPIDLAATEARRLLALTNGLDSPFWSLPVIYMGSTMG